MTLEELIKPENLKYSWLKAVVFEPDSVFPKSIDMLQTPSKYPVLIYLHGCGGLNEDSQAWGRTIKNLGFIVVQPDSFAIPGRKSNCDSKAQRGGLIKGFDVWRLRSFELQNALDELNKIDWVQKDQIFLMGHSEGALTASRTSVSGFKAVIASGYWCYEDLELKHGSSPFLFLNWQDDPWFRAKSNERNPGICQKHADRRPGTQQVIIEGQGHPTSGSGKARLVVEEFLKQQRN
jgi:dienelactone hydrolase